MTMPIIVMTKTLIRSAVTDNDWVCQMDWVPALSQVNRLPYSKIKNMKKKKKQGNLLGVGAFVAKSLSLVNILPWGSAWYAPLWLAQVFFVFELASYHQFHQQSNHIHHHYQHLYRCMSP